MNYTDFISKKLQYGADSGFHPLWMPDFLFGFQRFIVDRSIRKGRAAIFADCGLGKTPMFLTWAQNMIMKTNKPVLVLTPLAVGVQTLDEADKFGIDAVRATPDNKTPIVQIVNYEQLHHYDPSLYGAIVCDESSILKNFQGFRSAQIIEFMCTIPYRLLCTATASPNNHPEMGTSSEALGYMGYQDMLKEFFSRNQRFAISDRRGGKEEYYLRPHAADGPFWRWIVSWATAIRKPSDLGYSDSGFVLPGLTENDIEVRASKPTTGMMFDLEATNSAEELEATRRTVTDRCEAVADMVNSDGDHWLVWCNLNEEGDLLEKLIHGSVQISGSDSDDKKEWAARWFVKGEEQKRVLISKPRIFGYGMNFQHCHKMAIFPYKHSYEQYYQAVRRIYRFYQERPVEINRFFTNGGRRMLESIDRKAAKADEMFTQLVTHMNNELSVKKDYSNIQTIGVPKWMR